jgi:Protein of unknown function (DUF4244)
MRKCLSRLLATVHSVRRRSRGDEGMTTAEYAIGTLAAVAFAGVLLKVLTSDPVRGALAALVQRALQQ